MDALALVDTWPVDTVAAAVVIDGPEGTTVRTRGDTAHEFRLASIAKPITAWAVLVAVEEGIVTLDQPVGQPGCTLRHLLAHAGGYPFDGADPIAPPERRRIYSNTGIEMAADAVATASGMPFAAYLAEAVIGPLGMGATELRGSPAHGLWSTVDDMVRFTREVMAPRLIGAATAAEATSTQFAGLAGVIPGLGRYQHCDWGLGFEVRADKSPHWTGTRNSREAFGHFGGAGTLWWVDRGIRDQLGVACVALTDRPFDEWSVDALHLWPHLADAVIAEARG